MKMIQPACAALLLAATLSSCVSWVTVSRPDPIPSLGAQVAETGLVVIIDEGNFGAETLVAELSEVAQVTVREPRESLRWDPWDKRWLQLYDVEPRGLEDVEPRWLELSHLEYFEPVTVPTLRLESGSGPLTGVPLYTLTLLTLGIVPSRTPHEHVVACLLLLPEKPPREMIWSVEEPLFAWLPLLPITPFWAAWRETSAGATPDVWKIAAQDLRAMLVDPAGSTR